MRNRQKTKSKKQAVYLYIGLALWFLSLFILVGIYGLFEDSPHYNVFLTVSLIAFAFVAIALLFTAYCPKCEKIGAKNTFI